MNPLTDEEVETILERVRNKNGRCDTADYSRVNGMSEELRSNLESDTGFEDYLESVKLASE